MPAAATGKSVLSGIYLPGGASAGGLIASVCPAQQDRQQHAMPLPHGYGCPSQHPLLHVLLAAPGVSSPPFPGPAGGVRAALSQL